MTCVSKTVSRPGGEIRLEADVFKEDLEDTTSLLVNETRNTLDTSTACKTTDGGLRYA
jgi:hypothetical protein